MELEQWRLLVLLAEAGSVSKAAVVMDRPHSVISRKLSALEANCGGSLFYRTGRGVVLSELGEQLLPKVRRLLADADELSEEARSDGSVLAGRIRIGMVPSVALAIADPLLRRMQRRFPNVILSLLESTNGELGERVANGDLDIAVLFREQRNLMPTEEALKVVPAMLVGPPGDPLTSRPSVALRELADVPLVLSSSPGQFRLRLEHWARRLDVKLNIVAEADSVLILKRLIEAGAGYSVLTPIALAATSNTSPLSAARLVDPEIEFVLAMCRTTRRPMSVQVREVISIIRELTKPLTGDDPRHLTLHAIASPKRTTGVRVSA